VRPRLPTAVWILGFVSLLVDTSSEMIHAVLPLFLVQTLGVSTLTLGLFEGLAEATALIVKIFSGTLSDYVGRRKWLTVAGYGLSSLTKPLFALATAAPLVFTARLADRFGKGIRGAPRDALLTDVTPPELWGAAFGLRQSLDTAGAFLGPVIAAAWLAQHASDFRPLFWIATVPAGLAVALLIFGLDEPPLARAPRPFPLRRSQLALLRPAFWHVTLFGVLLTLARFSEAFLVLRAQQSGLALAWIPLVMAAMNAVFGAVAYPAGKLADRVSSRWLLAGGIAVLAAADLLLASPAPVWCGILLWGLHLGLTQGLLSKLIADAAPAALRATAFGVFHFITGLAMLTASTLAGWLWQSHGPPSTFLAGAVFCALALAAMRQLPARMEKIAPIE
jgi:MFS family permease